MTTSRRFLIAMACLFTLILLTSPALSQPDNAPNILLRAVQIPDGVRYTASLIKPSDLVLEAIYAEIVLPPGIQPLSVGETDRLPFAGLRAEADTTKLVWMESDFAADTFTPLTFTVAAPLEDDFEVYVEWAGGESGGSALISGKPDVSRNALAQYETLALTPEGTGAALQEVGSSGVFVGVAPGMAADGTLVRVRLPGPAENPPADLTTDEGELFWWCSLVDVADLPEDAAISVVVPLRQPLPPFTPVSLFALQEDGTWALLAEQGIVSADGQSLAYVHTGGVIAAGVDASLQPRLADLSLTVPEDLDRGVLIAGLNTDSEDASAAIPSCADTVDSTVLCRVYEGVYRQCLPDYINCAYSSEAFGICFDAGILGAEDGMGPMCTRVETS
ncbi:hypothetical protein FBR02_04605 [Anaerolineae bacterium CFX9]|nr:hypothetical protein [Anaerolineae bacterium CFX9]